MFYLLLFVFTCCLCVLLLCRKKNTEHEPPRLPGGLPFIGHGLLFVGDSIKSYQNITWISKECLKKGGIVSGYLGFRKAYCVTDPEAIQTISNTCLEKEHIYSFAKAFVGEGLITGNEILWKRHRKLLNPAFSQQVLNSFIRCFNNQARNLVHDLESHIGIPFDHEGLLRQHNLESICLTATGVGGDEYTDLQQKYLLIIPKLQIMLYERFKKLWFHSNFIYNLSKLKREENEIMKTFTHLSNQIIQKRKAEVKAASETLAGKKSGAVKPFLELMLDMSKASKCFTDKQIRHETDTIIAAGHETTATALNLALIVLGSYPEIQEKVYNEVLQVFKDMNRDLNKDDLRKLTYTEAVLNETLRLYPPVPVVARSINRDIRLRNCTLKANSACFLFFNGLNRHPAWGPDANQFRPERWLEQHTLPAKHYFGSFAIGKRNCIGKAYALMSMKITLAHLIRRYYVTADISKVVFKWHMLVYPASGSHYILRERD